MITAIDAGQNLVLVLDELTVDAKVVESHAVADPSRWRPRRLKRSYAVVVDPAGKSVDVFP